MARKGVAMHRGGHLEQALEGFCVLVRSYPAWNTFHHAPADDESFDPPALEKALLLDRHNTTILKWKEDCEDDLREKKMEEKLQGSLSEKAVQEDGMDSSGYAFQGRMSGEGVFLSCAHCDTSFCPCECYPNTLNMGHFS